MAVTCLPHTPKGRRVVHAHTRGALQQRLDDHGGDVFVRRQEVIEFPCPRLVSRQVGDVLRRQSWPEQRVHAVVRIAHRHRGKRIAVIAAAKRQELWSHMPRGIAPVLHRDLHRDLDRDRTGLAEEHLRQITRQDIGKTRRQPVGLFVR
jgi:hypothetical protein